MKVAGEQCRGAQAEQLERLKLIMVMMMVVVVVMMYNNATPLIGRPDCEEGR